MDRQTREGLRTLSEGEPSDEWTGKAVASEVMDTRVDKENIARHVRATMQEFVKLAQEMHGRVEQATKVVEGYAKTDVDLGMLERLVLAEVQEIWGDDPVAKLFAAMFARGKYIY